MSSEDTLRGWGEASLTPSTFAIDATNALFVPRTATAGVQMCTRPNAYLKVPLKYSKIVISINCYQIMPCCSNAFCLCNLIFGVPV